MFRYSPLLADCIVDFYTRQDILGQYSMVNLELFNIVDEIKKVSKAFVVHPKNVNAENSTSMSLHPFQVFDEIKGTNA